MKGLLFSCMAAALSAGAVEPRVILDCASLEAPKWIKRINPLVSGWERDNEGNFLHPFNEVPAGKIDFRTAWRLTAGKPIKLEFLDRGKRPLFSKTYTGEGVQNVRESFRHDGSLQYLRLSAARDQNLTDVFLDGARVFVDWAAFEREFHLGPGATRAPEVDKSLLTNDYAFEFKVFMGEGVSLTAGGVDIDRLYPYHRGIWYRFRFEVKGNRARVKLNGREIARNVSFGGFELVNRGKSPLRVDDLKVHALVDHADYPAPPVEPVGQEKHLVGINICSLWRDGYHVGWNCIDRKGGPRPTLGFYDEGLPELADWEIKYFVEHGVDFQAFCWYADTDDGAIHRPNFEFQLEDGFKNARYSDRMKYCLIWEIQNAGRPHTLEAWKKNFVPYFIEHHFKDPRYLVLDGKPVLSVFGAWNFPTEKKGFGSVSKTREAFDYLREEVKKIGFKGVIFISSNSENFKADAAMGFDIQLPYNFGGDAHTFEYNVKRNENRLAKAAGTGMFAPPAVAVGFDNLPWGGNRRPMLSVENFKKTLYWMRDDFGPRTWQKGTWQENFHWICTWNEYGEGTYLIPTHDSRKFGYLDAVREVFTDAKAPDASIDMVPTRAQLARVANLYPQPPWTPVRVALTFDDNKKDHLTIAAPELEKRGWRGVFCVVPSWVGGAKELSWDDVRELDRRGHEIANHTLSHAALGRLCEQGNTNEVRRQIAAANDIFKREIGHAPHLLCLPGGSNHPEVAIIAKSMGMEVMAPGREAYGEWKRDVARDVARFRAQGRARVDFMVHGIRPEGGGWKPFPTVEAFRAYLDAIEREERAGNVSVGPYVR